MYDNLVKQRFFRAKQAGISSFVALDSVDVGPGRWVLADIDGELYQLVLGADDDILGDPAVLAQVQKALSAKQAFGKGDLEVISQPVVPHDATVSLSSAEQSNSSLIFRGEAPVIVKFFRKLEPGINPDVELLSGLSKVGCGYVPALRAYSTISHDGQTYVTAMAQDFAAGSREGWDLATSYAKESKDFTEEATLIGQALAAVHRDLDTAFGSQLVSAADIVAGLEHRRDSLMEQAPVLRDFAAGIEQAYQEAAQGDTRVQRIHGDAHLGQILRTDDRYLFIDFEGEPARPLAERRQMFSPLQDLAGIIRSFGYAAHSGVNQTWADDCEHALLQAYGAEDSPLLRALILDKALYEVAYEVNNRPDWVEIPLSAVRRIVG